MKALLPLLFCPLLHAAPTVLEFECVEPQERLFGFGLEEWKANGNSSQWVWTLSFQSEEVDVGELTPGIHIFRVFSIEKTNMLHSPPSEPLTLEEVAALRIRVTMMESDDGITWLPGQVMEYSVLPEKRRRLYRGDITFLEE